MSTTVLFSICLTCYLPVFLSDSPCIRKSSCGNYRNFLPGEQVTVAKVTGRRPPSRTTLSLCLEGGDPTSWFHLAGWAWSADSTHRPVLLITIAEWYTQFYCAFWDHALTSKLVTKGSCLPSFLNHDQIMWRASVGSGVKPVQDN